MGRPSPQRVPLLNTEIRRIMLEYFHRRNKNAMSSMGKKGSAVKISDVKRELKASHELTQQEVQSNLTYLISEGWVEEKAVQKTITAQGGTVIPSTTTFYQITSAGIDKIEGAGEFTRPKFHGIKIEATGQNIITVGDGNQVNAQYGKLGTALAELREAIVKSDAPEVEKLDLVADVETVQSQLAKREPNRDILKTAWSSLKAAATINGAAAFVQKVGGLLGGLI